MGISESMIKSIAEPINACVHDVCGHIAIKSDCGCWTFVIDNKEEEHIPHTLLPAINLLSRETNAN